MNQYVTGTMIRELREKKGMTQAELADRLFVSDKTVSKWENGKGYPDVSMLEGIAGALTNLPDDLLSTILSAALKGGTGVVSDAVAKAITQL